MQQPPKVPARSVRVPLGPLACSADVSDQAIRACCRSTTPSINWSDLNGAGGGRVMRVGLFLGLALSLLAASAWAAEGETIGSVKNLQGQATVVRNQQSLPARVGMALIKSDLLKTGSNSTIGVILRDDTLLSLGPDSEIALADFAFSPSEGKLSFVARMMKGTAACLTGQIGRLSPGSFRFETPVANIGIRGTMFAVKIEDDRS